LARLRCLLHGKRRTLRHTWLSRLSVHRLLRERQQAPMKAQAQLRLALEEPRPVRRLMRAPPALLLQVPVSMRAP
jgi:hypothetical protein